MSEEEIKDLESYISFSKKSNNFSHDTDYKWHKELGEKIEHLLQAYKDAIIDRDIAEGICKEHRILLADYRKDLADSTPNEKIREKIEELKKMKIEGEVFTTAVSFAIQVLQEILEEGSNKW